MTVLLLIAGLIALVIGAELLVRGASRLAVSAGVSPLVIGLTVVAFGTSAPELAVSVKSALAGQANLALGNVIGSNTFNVLFILGLSALVAPLLVSSQLVRLDVPVMIFVSLLATAFAWDGVISHADGALLAVGAVIYTGVLLMLARRAGEINSDAIPASNAPVWLSVTYVVVGLLLLVIGSRWLVDSAVTIATTLGVSDLVIGLTVVAAGTSLPELVTSVIASIRGERDIAVGNVVGSNIFNLLVVLAAASLVAPDGVTVAQSVLYFDLPVMTGVAIACLPIFFTGMTIARWEGALLFGYYIAYAAYLLMAATRHDALDTFRTAMLWFVIPLTAVTLVLLSARSWRQNSLRGD